MRSMYIFLQVRYGIDKAVIVIHVSVEIHLFLSVICSGHVI